MSEKKQTGTDADKTVVIQDGSAIDGIFTDTVFI